MVFAAIAAVALATAFGAGLAIGRDAVVATVGVMLFLVAGTYQATGGEGEREPINGAAGYMLWLVLLLVPWLVGIVAARLVRRKHARSG